MTKSARQSLPKTAPYARHDATLAYRAQRLHSGRFRVCYGADGVDIQIRGERAFAIVVVGGFLLLLLIVIAGTLMLPAGSTNFYGIYVQIPEGWPTRAGAVIAIILLVPCIFFLPGTVRSMRIDCRVSTLIVDAPLRLRTIRELELPREQIADIHAGAEYTGDCLEYFVLIVDKTGTQHQLSYDLTPTEAIELGRILRNACGLPPHPQDERDFKLS